jgi:hypothetical protein
MTTPPVTNPPIGDPAYTEISAPPRPPVFARVLALGLSAVLALSVLPALWLTLFAGEAVLWFSTVFELLVLAAAMFGLAAGLGRFIQGWALTLVCVGGTVLVCGVFAFLEVRANFGSSAAVAGWIKPYLAFRLALAAAFAGTASLAIFVRNPASWKALMKGALVLAPALAVLAWIGLTGGAFLSATRPSPGAEAARILMLCLGGMVLIGLISVGAHLIIRAYELGRPEAAPGGSGKA